MLDKSGAPAPIWSDWFKHLFTRVGGHSALSNTELYDYMGPRLVPPGTVLDFAGTSAPTGFLMCNGASLLRADYPDLFAAIGTTYGAADADHFTLPGAQGRAAIGKASAGTFSTLGGTGGAESATLPEHAHSAGTLANGNPSATTDIQDTGAGIAMPTGTHTHTISGNTGNPTTSPTIATLPPYLVLNRIIKS